MDNVNRLSVDDQKLLNRLNIPQGQKVLLENYWLENPVVSKRWSVWDVLSMFLRPLIIAMLASPYFVTGTTPFINMSLVALWVLCIVTLGVYFFVAITLSILAEKQKDELMGRSFVTFLPGARSSFRKGYAIICWILLAGLTASQGYFTTSVMILLCWIGVWIFNIISELTLMKFLEDRIMETPSQRITRMVLASLNK